MGHIGICGRNLALPAITYINHLQPIFVTLTKCLGEQISKGWLTGAQSAMAGCGCSQGIGTGSACAVRLRLFSTLCLYVAHMAVGLYTNHSDRGTATLLAMATGTVETEFMLLNTDSCHRS